MSDPIGIRYLKDVLGVRSIIRPLGSNNSYSVTPFASEVLPADIIILYDRPRVLIQAQRELAMAESALIKKMITAIKVDSFSYVDKDFEFFDYMPRVSISGLADMVANSALAVDLKKRAWSDLQLFTQAIERSQSADEGEPE